MSGKRLGWRKATGTNWLVFLDWFLEGNWTADPNESLVRAVCHPQMRRILSRSVSVVLISDAERQPQYVEEWTDHLLDHNLKALDRFRNIAIPNTAIYRNRHARNNPFEAVHAGTVRGINGTTSHAAGAALKEFRAVPRLCRLDAMEALAGAVADLDAGGDERCGSPAWVLDDRGPPSELPRLAVGLPLALAALDYFQVTPADRYEHLWLVEKLTRPDPVAFLGKRSLSLPVRESRTNPGPWRRVAAITQSEAGAGLRPPPNAGIETHGPTGAGDGE